MTAISRAVTTEVALAPSREERFARFVEEHRERAVRLAWRLVGEDRASAEEVAQDAFLRAFRALPGFRDEARLSTWFYRILVRQASNRRRWRGVRLRWGALWGAGGDPDGAEIETVWARPAAEGDPSLRARIQGAMERLSPGQRTVFTLVHLEGFTVVEAAEIAGCVTGTAKSHLHRALRTLRAVLAPEREEYGP